LACIKQQPVRVFYDELAVGDYFADIVVEGLVILELKAGRSDSRRARITIDKLS
jgi:hypothetical protein